VHPLHHQGTKLLPKEKSAHQEKVGVPSKSDAGKKPEGNDKGHWNVNGQEPLGCEAPDICSLVSEGDIQEKHNGSSDD
jgi:hypothetical protein